MLYSITYFVYVIVATDCFKEKRQVTVKKVEIKLNPTNIYLFKVAIETLETGVKYVQI